MDIALDGMVRIVEGLTTISTTHSLYHKYVHYRRFLWRAHDVSTKVFTTAAICASEARNSHLEHKIAAGASSSCCGVLGLPLWSNHNCAMVIRNKFSTSAPKQQLKNSQSKARWECSYAKSALKAFLVHMHCRPGTIRHWNWLSSKRDIKNDETSVKTHVPIYDGWMSSCVGFFMYKIQKFKNSNQIH